MREKKLWTSRNSVVLHRFDFSMIRQLIYWAHMYDVKPDFTISLTRLTLLSPGSSLAQVVRERCIL